MRFWSRFNNRAIAREPQELTTEVQPDKELAFNVRRGESMMVRGSIVFSVAGAQETQPQFGVEAPIGSEGGYGIVDGAREFFGFGGGALGSFTNDDGSLIHVPVFIYLTDIILTGEVRIVIRNKLKAQSQRMPGSYLEIIR